MPHEWKRFTISVPPEQEKELDDLKRHEFYNKAQSEMLRHLISLGLKSLKDKSENKS